MILQSILQHIQKSNEVPPTGNNGKLFYLVLPFLGRNALKWPGFGFSKVWEEGAEVGRKGGVDKNSFLSSQKQQHLAPNPMKRTKMMDHR